MERKLKLSKFVVLAIFFTPQLIHASERIDQIEDRLDKIEKLLMELSSQSKSAEKAEKSNNDNSISTARFSPGLWMEFHRLKIKNEKDRPLSPEGTPLGAILDENSPKFEFTSFMKDENLKKYYNESYGLSWTGYIHIKEGGPQIFALDVAYKSEKTAEKIHCSTSLSMDSRNLIEFKPYFDTHDKSVTKTEISEVNLDKGMYPIQVWLTCRTKLNLRIQIISGISASLNYRAPSARSLAPVPKDQLLHQI